MHDEDASELRHLQNYVTRRQREIRIPQRIDELMSRLMARSGYARLLAGEDMQAQWNTAVGPQLAAQTRCGNLRRGVLFVVVANSAVMHELMFQKTHLIRQLNKNLKSKVSDLRCRIGTIE